MHVFALWLLSASFFFLAGMLVGMGIAERSLSALERRFARIEELTSGTFNGLCTNQEIEIPSFEQESE